LQSQRWRLCKDPGRA